AAHRCPVNSCDTLAQGAPVVRSLAVRVLVSMQVRLIINADDFGLTPGINRAIAELHDAGAVTSATLMATGPAFDDAVALAQARPSLGVGCHIVLVDGTPVSDPATIPTLLGPDRRTFRNSLGDFALGVLRGAIRQDHIQREALAQIQQLQRAGLKLTHVDTHKHTHLLSRVARPIIRALDDSGIRSIRNPFEPGWAATLGGSTRRSLFVRALDLAPAVSSQLAAPSASPQPAISTALPSGICSKPSPTAPGSSSAIPAITTPILMPSPRACAPNARPSSAPCSPSQNLYCHQ